MGDVIELHGYQAMTSIDPATVNDAAAFDTRTFIKEEKERVDTIRRRIASDHQIKGKTCELLARNLGEILARDKRNPSREILAAKALGTTMMNASQRLSRFQIRPGKEPSLKALGIPDPGSRETDDLRALVIIAEDHAAGQIPENPQERWSRYELIKRLELHPFGTLVCKKWLDLLEPKSGPYDADLRIQATYFLRRSGKVKEAIVGTDVLRQPRSLFPADDGQISVLSTIRASSLLDLFEIDHDPARLIEAKNSLSRAWATKPSNIVSSVYQRYHKLAG